MGVTSPVPSASDGTSGSPSSPASLARRRMGLEPTCCCKPAAAALFDSSSAARSVSASGWIPPSFPGFPSGSLGGLLPVRNERGMHLPVRRMIPAEFGSKPLAQELLRPCAATVPRLSEQLNLGRSLPRCLMLRSGDESLIAHAGEHAVTALERAFIIRPWCER